MGPSVCVLGAGIAGLHSAYYIQQALPRVQLTVVADNFVEGTVSNLAGALIGPSPFFKGPYENCSKEWGVFADRLYRGILNSAEGSEAGVCEIPMYGLSNKSDRFAKNEEWDELSSSSHPLTEAEKDLFGGCKYGYFRMVITIDPSQYMTWMMRNLKAKGCKFIEQRVSSLEELGKKYDIVINCTGLMAKFLCNDDKVVPIRGQVFKVKAPWIKQVVYSETDTYIIPSPQVVTIGGCRNYNSWDENVNKHIANDIWERCTAVMPSLKQAEIVGEYVGFRPHREPLRLEVETIGNTKVVHHYGHGAYGWSMSPGSAKMVSDIVKDMIASDKILSKL